MFLHHPKLPARLNTPPQRDPPINNRRAARTDHRLAVSPPLPPSLGHAGDHRQATIMGKHGNCSHDAEACYPPGAVPGGGGMYPYMMESPQMRWAFIRKVYVIVTLQLLLTVAVAAAVNLVGAVSGFFRSRTPAALIAFIGIIIAPIIGTPAPRRAGGLDPRRTIDM